MNVNARAAPCLLQARHSAHAPGWRWIDHLRHVWLWAAGRCYADRLRCLQAALMALARSVAAQYGKEGIRSNAIMIGFVLNEHAQKGVPQEIKQILLIST
jgi:hypothetical protein